MLQNKIPDWLIMRCVMLLGIAVSSLLPWQQTLGQSQPGTEELAVIFLIDQSESMGSFDDYCGVRNGYESDPNKLRFLGPQFALDWLGRAYLSHLKSQGIAVQFGTIYFGGYERAFNVFAEDFDQGLVPVHPDNIGQWKTAFDDAVRSLSASAENIYAYNRTTGQEQCTENSQKRNLNLGQSDPIGGIDLLEEMLSDISNDARVMAVMLTDGLPTVSKGEGAPTGRITSPEDEAGTRRYLSIMADRIAELESEYPNLDFHVVALAENGTTGGNDWTAYTDEWQAIDLDLQVETERLTLAARFQRLFTELVDAYGLGTMTEVSCGAEFVVPPLTDQLRLTIHKPAYGNSAIDGQFRLFRNNVAFATLDQDLPPNTKIEELTIEVVGTASPIQVVQLSGPVGGVWRLQCAEYLGSDDSPTRIFVQHTPLDLALVAPYSMPIAGLPAPIALVGKRTNGERVDLLPYTGPNARAEITLLGARNQPRPLAVEVENGRGDTIRRSFVAHGAGIYTATLVALEIDDQMIRPASSITLPISFNAVRPQLTAVPGDNFLFPANLTLRFIRPNGSTTTIEPETLAAYEIQIDAYRSDGTLATQHRVDPKTDSGLSVDLALPEPGVYTITTTIADRALPTTTLQSKPTTIVVNPLPPTSHVLEGLPEIAVNWLETYSVTLPLAGDDGLPIPIPNDDSRYQYSGELHFVDNETGDPINAIFPIAFNEGRLSGSLQFDLPAGTHPVAAVAYLVRTDTQNNDRTSAIVSSPHVFTVTSPIMDLRILPSSLPAGCPSPVTLEATLQAAGMTYRPVDAITERYHIEPTLYQSESDGQTKELTPILGEDYWQYSELLCFFPDIFNSHSVTFTAGYNLLDRSSPIAVQPVQVDGTVVAYQLIPPAISTIQTMYVNPYIRVFLGLVATAVTLVIAADWKRKRRDKKPLPANLHMRSLTLFCSGQSEYNQGSASEQSAGTSGEKESIVLIDDILLTQRKQIWEPNIPSNLRSCFHKVEIEYIQGKRPEVGEWMYLVTVRDATTKSFKWLDRAPIFYDTKRCTSLRLPGEYTLVVEDLRTNNASDRHR